ncbi:MAG: methyl-accepting chemotaxis protein [Anaerolineae bacterium]|nr:methyl-accepting chemotaxis protein [Anaerolineae bacterium]
MKEQKPEITKPESRFLSLRIKIWLGFTLIFLPVFIGSYVWFYYYTRDRVFQTITDDLVQTIHGALAGMDKEGFVALYEQESTNNPMCPPKKDAPDEENGYYPEDNPLYIEHENWLRAVQQTELKEDVSKDPTQETTRLYTYIKGPDEGEVIAIGSTGYFRATRGGFRFCQRYTSTNSRIYDGLTGRVDAWEPYTDKFGTWITTYAPIVDDNGKVIGAIGVDITAKYVDEVTNGILRQGIIAFIVTFSVIFVLVYWLSGFLTRPIISLAGVAKEIGEGDYSHEWLDNVSDKTSRDEIDTLTEIFKVMVDKVAQREKSLRARVQQLEIMVDKSKLTKQVNEIVESDFFQDLQSKVKGMRNRFSKED